MSENVNYVFEGFDIGLVLFFVALIAFIIWRYWVLRDKYWKAVREQGELKKALGDTDTIWTLGPIATLLPSPLICHKCGKEGKSIAHWTGEGWDLSLDCENQHNFEAWYFKWPNPERPILRSQDLEQLGFEVV